MKIKTGIAQGRFHIVHWGHIEYLLKAKEKCEYLVIGVTDCDPERAYFPYKEKLKEFDEKNLLTPFRSFENPIFPFTFYDRLRMITDALIDEGINTTDFCVVPFPVHNLKMVKYYIPLNGVIFSTIYDKWGEEKIKMFKNMGFKIEILWKRDLSKRFTTGTEVRKRIMNKEKWEHLVPKTVYNYINNLAVSKIQ